MRYLVLAGCLLITSNVLAEGSNCAAEHGYIVKLFQFDLKSELEKVKLDQSVEVDGRLQSKLRTAIKHCRAIAICQTNGKTIAPGTISSCQTRLPILLRKAVLKGKQGKEAWMKDVDVYLREAGGQIKNEAPRPTGRS